MLLGSPPSPRRSTPSPRRSTPSLRRLSPSPRRLPPLPRSSTPSPSFFDPKCIFPKFNYSKCIFAKCTRLACLLSFASLFIEYCLNSSHLFKRQNLSKISVEQYKRANSQRVKKQICCQKYQKISKNIKKYQ